MILRIRRLSCYKPLYVGMIRVHLQDYSHLNTRHSANARGATWVLNVTPDERWPSTAVLIVVVSHVEPLVQIKLDSFYKRNLTSIIFFY